MISDYLFKGIDNIFTNKLTHPTKTHKPKPLTRELIKANINQVVKERTERNDRYSPMNKSRIRTILQQNKEERLKSVFKQHEAENRSPSPYRRIEGPSASPAGDEENDKILYYREQRKNMEKSRVLEKGKINNNSNSRIIQNNSQAQLKHKSKSNSKLPSGKLDIAQVVRF